MADPESEARSAYNRALKRWRNEAQERTDYNRALNNGDWYSPIEPPRQQANRVTAENYVRTYPGAAIGHVSRDGNNMQFDTPSAFVNIGPDHATTTVENDLGWVTANPNHTLTVETRDGRYGTVNNAPLADAMVQIGSAAANSRSHGLPVMTPTDANTLAADASVAIAQLPRATARPRNR